MNDAKIGDKNENSINTDLYNDLLFNSTAKLTNTLRNIASSMDSDFSKTFTWGLRTSSSLPM